MIEVRGTYFDGVGSRGVEATLTLYDGSVVLVGADSEVEVAIADVRVDARLGNTPRRITWGGVDSFVTDDNAAADELADSLPQGMSLGWVAWLEQRIAIALVSLVLVFGVGVAFAVWGVPAIAEYAAYAIPEEVSDQLGATTLSNIENLLATTELSEDRQQALRDYFSEFGRVNRLHFKKSSMLGANAFALSCTTLTFTDELVELAEHDEELLAVYLHELGHAELRHVERSILQGSAWVVLLTVITGDLSGVGQLILTLPLVIGQTAYSREFERAADEFAVDKLIDAGVSPLRLATILQKLEASHLSRRSDDEDAVAEDAEGNDPEAEPQESEEEGTQEIETEDRVSKILFDYLSTHPATSERVEYIQRRASEL